MKHANPAIDRSVPAFMIERVSRFTPEEETANTISHIIGTMLAVYATVLMLFFAIRLRRLHDRFISFFNPEPCFAHGQGQECLSQS